MVSIKDKTVAELVSENINTAHVFKKHGIDFCCGGGISISRACKKNQVKLDVLLNDLQNLEDKGRTYDYKKWNLHFLAQHIQNVHHSYVEDSIPLLIQYSNKVASVHSKTNPELIQIKKLFAEVANELSQHLRKEELILFPFIAKMEAAFKKGEKVERPHFGTIENPIAMMEDEHEAAGDKFKEIADLTNNYTLPPHACNTYKALYHKLEEFENDLHLHIHLENNILFPKALAMEKETLS
ncbi:iron-sulfur cluster repair di-iron protein [Psychroflexus torquis ATCC 700755]|uniref:Iron-sulfur cluster repair di-iron protein n=1 Tax=Psychroflexus torquis (strain ATCC 700755 / CIP 106069 / ACAM 623) TaxID=313595 RepID=K4IBA4_PSYTT|nr:iron-sulfur cluster repair di-iron protein [Psychroflexus torquis]AFU67709.1 iron-sulfur cluster repair di-iron protein [Psychroflexus torquis ATCC 700755]